MGCVWSGNSSADSKTVQTDPQTFFDEDKALEKLDPNTNNTKSSFNGRLVRARVLSVYDGDTVNIAFFPSFETFSVRNTPYVSALRLDGLDAPEVKPRGIESPELKDLHKEAGAKVRDLVKSFVLDQIVWVRFSEHSDREMYGRLLGSIYLKDPTDARTMSLNQYLLHYQLCKPYDGGTKTTFSADDLTKIVQFKCTSSLR